jgi:hypothetical protein
VKEVIPTHLYEYIKDSTIVEKTDIDAFLITERNRIQTAL